MELTAAERAKFRLAVLREEMRAEEKIIAGATEAIRAARERMAKWKKEEEEIAHILAPKPEILAPQNPPTKRHKPTMGDIQNVLHDVKREIAKGEDCNEDLLLTLVGVLVKTKKKDRKIAEQKAEREKEIAAERAKATQARLRREAAQNRKLRPEDCEK